MEDPDVPAGIASSKAQRDMRTRESVNRIIRSSHADGQSLSEAVPRIARSAGVDCCIGPNAVVCADAYETPAADERRSSALTPSSRPLSMEAGVSDGLVSRVAR
jgi:hypothetical protein